MITNYQRFCTIVSQCLATSRRLRAWKKARSAAYYAIQMGFLRETAVLGHGRRPDISALSAIVVQAFRRKVTCELAQEVCEHREYRDMPYCHQECPVVQVYLK